jgi:hypothetical protein
MGNLQEVQELAPEVEGNVKSSGNGKSSARLYQHLGLAFVEIEGEKNIAVDVGHGLIRYCVSLLRYSVDVTSKTPRLQGHTVLLEHLQTLDSKDLEMWPNLVR